jgi:hypothetical protein
LPDLLLSVVSIFWRVVVIRNDLVSDHPDAKASAALDGKTKREPRVPIACLQRGEAG